MINGTDTCHETIIVMHHIIYSSAGENGKSLSSVALAHPIARFFTWMQHACTVEASAYMYTYDVTCVT